MEIAMMSLRWVVVLALCFYGYKKKDLTTWILVSMAIGAEIGYDFPTFAKELKILSDIFLKLIKTIIAPLLIGTLVVGIAGHSDMKQVGRMGVKALVYFEVVTTIALVVGLIAINFTKAGEGIDLSAAQKTGEKLAEVAHQDWKQIVLHIFPENIAKAIANGEVLQIVVFSILFAIGLTMVAPHHRKVMIGFLETLSEVMFKFTNIIMYFAPFAVGGAIAYTIGTMGLDIFKNLIMLLLTLYGALLVFVFLVLLPIALAVKVPLKQFLQAIAEPVSLAFATASSEAALPKAMKAMQSIGVPQKIVAFVMPTGYSFNLDGTTLYLSLASIFVAQAAGIDLPLETQIVMCLTLMLTSKGVAGVARASLVILSGTVASFNLPAEPIMVILGIDALMDMGRTSVNVIGNCLATVVVAKWEGEFGKVEEEIDMIEMQEEMEH
ncbi:dicarboxylate/amino acid:cation symporter [Thermoflexibacter ruber]|uniref:Proton glutamate symport protein n=1 Tax=Thermoflexibacter ruber TaxID=1003 RepID=A0A1I2C8G1_9BACT|nr:cation:dicarboxylase symporter family transporter [Thermoflexibacter ruber]SFE64554.1 proton glutamate symport protein [Thermoflexibacter ruber]